MPRFIVRSAMTPGARAGVQRIEGLILAQRNVGERDRVLDMLVRGRGRMSVWSQKSRGHTRRQALHALAPFVSALLLVRPRSDGVTLVGQEEVNERYGLRSKLRALQRAGQLVALAQALFLPGEPVDYALATLDVALDHLAAGRVARAAGAYPRLLKVAGVLPSFDQCSRCKRAFSAERRPTVDTVELSCRSCVPMASLLEEPLLQALAGARIESSEVADAVESIVIGWAGHHVGRALRLQPWA